MPARRDGCVRAAGRKRLCPRCIREQHLRVRAQAHFAGLKLTPGPAPGLEAKSDPEHNWRMACPSRPQALRGGCWLHSGTPAPLAKGHCDDTHTTTHARTHARTHAHTHTHTHTRAHTHTHTDPKPLLVRLSLPGAAVIGSASFLKRLPRLRVRMRQASARLGPQAPAPAGPALTRTDLSPSRRLLSMKGGILKPQVAPL